MELSKRTAHVVVAEKSLLSATVSPSKLPELPGLDHSRSDTFYGIAFLLLILFLVL